MTISEAYSIYKTPPNLQEHMLRVTKVGLFVCDHWVGPSIDRGLIKRALLLHDMGNLVKFDLDNLPHLLGKEAARIDYWKQIQQEFRIRFGMDDHLATQNILKDMGLDLLTSTTVIDMGFQNAVTVAHNDAWEAKVCLYADLRVAPSGVISLSDRLKEVTERSKTYRNRDDLFNAASQIEKQIQMNMNVGADQIKNESIDYYDPELSVPISVS